MNITIIVFTSSTLGGKAEPFCTMADALKWFEIQPYVNFKNLVFPAEAGHFNRNCITEIHDQKGHFLGWIQTKEFYNELAIQAVLKEKREKL